LSIESIANPRRTRQLKLSICLALGLGTLALYAPVRNYEFLNYDDDDYVSDNPHVLGGFTRENVVYSLAHFHASNWHPVTWLSHMLDVKLWGRNAGGHHLTNVILHAVNAVLLFLVFNRMTGTLWRSAFVAVVFAWHPLHVESVAWISERKDILCALFWILTTAAYVSYVRRPAASKYLLIVLLFILGLMSKPMIVTLPFVLLLLDYWPLNRATLERADMSKWLQLFLEKTPLLVLALLASRLTISTQHRTGALKSALEFPWQLRIANAPLSYIGYIWKAVWPVNLAVLYPLPSAISPWQAIGATALLLMITALVLVVTKRAPYLPVGWFWYVGTLLPVIGLVQVGSQSMADRYTYLPLVGLTIAGAWGAQAFLEKTKNGQVMTAFLFIMATLLMIQGTERQLRYWQSSLTLFQRTVSVTSNNGIAHGNLSAAFLSQFKPDAAAAEAREAIRILPNHPVGYMSLGMAMLMQRRTSEAIVNLEKALQLQPDWPDIHQDLGGALILVGRVEDAIPHFYETLRLSPDHVPALKALAWIRATHPNPQLRDASESLRLAERASQLRNGKDAQALDVLAAALAEGGRYDEAIKTGEQARNLAITTNKAQLASEIAGRLDLYRLGLPYRTRR
jgi:tetratricopeptide (TPR) repeat protein